MHKLSVSIAVRFRVRFLPIPQARGKGKENLNIPPLSRPETLTAWRFSRTTSLPASDSVWNVTRRSRTKVVSFSIVLKFSTNAAKSAKFTSDFTRLYFLMRKIQRFIDPIFLQAKILEAKLFYLHIKQANSSFFFRRSKSGKASN